MPWEAGMNSGHRLLFHRCHGDGGGGQEGDRPFPFKDLAGHRHHVCRKMSRPGPPGTRIQAPTLLLRPGVQGPHHSPPQTRGSRPHPPPTWGPKSPAPPPQTWGPGPPPLPLRPREPELSRPPPYLHLRILAHSPSYPRPQLLITR